MYAVACFVSRVPPLDLTCGSAAYASQGLAFIATADIEDEELFLNYRSDLQPSSLERLPAHAHAFLCAPRYNPNNPLPDWYTPVDAEGDREMWK